MKIALSLALACVLSAVVAQEKEKQKSPLSIDSPMCFRKAEDFIEMSELDRANYSMGLMDGFYASAFLGARKESISRLNTCTKEMDVKQISAIITKYVKDHPESWHFPLSIEAINALETTACQGVTIKE